MKDLTGAWVWSSGSHLQGLKVPDDHRGRFQRSTLTRAAFSIHMESLALAASPIRGCRASGVGVCGNAFLGHSNMRPEWRPLD